MKRTLPLAVTVALVPLHALADEIEAFVTANVMDILYHELGHAIIDTELLPVFGKEETAADYFAAIMMHVMHSPKDARAHILHVADGYAANAEVEPHDDGSGMHDSYPERYFNTLCLLHGSAPNRTRFLLRNDWLPEDRAETCEEEYDLAFESWTGVLDVLEGSETGHKLLFANDMGEPTLAQSVIAEQVVAINARFSFAQDIVVRFEFCDEANAFYDPEDVSIIFCAEFEDELYDLAPAP
ncbi:MAG: DUF4344 domain-containing metallopeptidase [Pseudomonadota bacterium]